MSETTGLRNYLVCQLRKKSVLLKVSFGYHEAIASKQIQSQPLRCLFGLYFKVNVKMYVNFKYLLDLEIL